MSRQYTSCYVMSCLCHVLHHAHNYVDTSDYLDSVITAEFDPEMAVKANHEDLIRSAQPQARAQAQAQAHAPQSHISS